MINRRTIIKGAASAGLIASASGLAHPAYAARKPLKIGFVSPQTGPLAIFSEPDKHVLNAFKKQIGDGIMINGAKHPVEFIVKDSQSSSNRASTVAQDLIFKDKVDLITATSTPDTTNPVADQAELNGVSCITNDTPWQPHFFGRQGDPKKGFDYTYHFFWGLEDVVEVFMAQWNAIANNKVVGALWPNDPDGNGWAHPERGFPPIMEKNGFKLIDTGRFQNLSDDFSAQISAFKSAEVEIVSGVMIPPDFTTFWTQAAQQGFKPKVVNVAKASEFPQAMGALGDRADGLSVEVWWHKTSPFNSSFTRQTSAEIAAEYEAATGAPSTMPLGFKHSLFEVAIDALKRTQDPTSPESIAKAIGETSLETCVGKVDFSTGPVPNVSKTPLVGGQWNLDSKGKPHLDITVNPGNPNIKTTAEMKSIA